MSNDQLALQRYLIEQLERHRDRIAPELREFVTGTTETEIDQAIQRATEKTSSILQSAGLQPPRQQPGGPFEADLRGGYGDGHVADLDVAAMSMAEFAEFRRMAGLGQSRQDDNGIFGRSTR
jgi:hypothetical protein